MPFPVAAAIAGVGAVASLFGNKRKDPKVPDFGGGDLTALETFLRQKNEAAGAGAIDSTREELANSGLLQSGNLPDAITRIRAGLAGQNYNDVANLHLAELNRKRDFQVQKYFADLGIYNQNYQQGRESRSSALGALGGAVGSYFGEKESDRKFGRLMEYFNKSAGSGQSFNPSPQSFGIPSYDFGN